MIDPLPLVDSASSVLVHKKRPVVPPLVVEVVVVCGVPGAVAPRVDVLEVEEELVRLPLDPDPHPPAGRRVQAAHPDQQDHREKARRRQVVSFAFTCDNRNIRSV